MLVSFRGLSSGSGAPRKAWKAAGLADARNIALVVTLDSPAAAERAIRRCDPFPRKRDGSVDRVIDVRMQPVEVR
jgi:hypothetical protein